MIKRGGGSYGIIDIFIGVYVYKPRERAMVINIHDMRKMWAELYCLEFVHSNNTSSSNMHFFNNYLYHVSNHKDRPW